MSDSLFYELLTKGDPERSRNFRKLPSITNPVVLLPGFGELMRMEILTSEPCGLPSSHCQPYPFEFHQGLAAGTYKFPPQAKEVLKDERAWIRKGVATLREKAAVIPSMFPDHIVEGRAPSCDTLTELEEAIADVETIRPFLAQLQMPEGAPPLPSADLVGPNWAIVVYLQTQILLALDLYRRYPQGAPAMASVQKKIEHDWHDAQYVMFGAVEGCLATNDTNVKRLFSLLRPNGVLLAP